jgi:hypothetical protein
MPGLVEAKIPAASVPHIPDKELQLEEFHSVWHHRARDQSDQDRRAGGDKGAARAARHQAGDPSVGGERRVGFAEAESGDAERSERGRRCRKQRVDDDKRDPQRRDGVEDDRSRGIQPGPSHQRQ